MSSDMTDTVYRRVRLTPDELVDVHVTKGLIAAFVPPSPDSATIDAKNIVDATNHLLLPPLVEPHAHLDKAFLSERIDNPTGDLMGAIRGMETARATLNRADTTSRAVRAVHLLSTRGVQLIRSHADTTVDTSLQNVEALLEVKAGCSSIADLQVAALVGWPLSGLAGAENRALARAAIEAGVDVIGGCPHLDENPAESLRFLFDLANEAGVALDLHADENTRTTSIDLETCADMVISTGSRIDIAASHCVSLGCQPESIQHRVADKVAQASMRVIALPLTNLYLQGRESSSNVPRGLAPIPLLRSHGVIVAAGGDNLQDPFNPLGKGDPLETACFMVLAGHDLIEDALSAVTRHASIAVGVTPVDIKVGSPADFLLINAATAREAVSMQTHERVVVRRGIPLQTRI